MKNLILILISIILTNTAWTQNKYLDYKYALKIYNLSTYSVVNMRASGKNDSKHFDIYKANLEIINPTIALQWKTKKNNFKEIEFTKLNVAKLTTITSTLNDSTSIKENVENIDQKSTVISIRYEYQINFSKQNDRKMTFLIGLGFNPYITLDKYRPQLSSFNPSSFTNVGFNFFVIPHLSYNLTSRIFVNLNIPINVTNINLEHVYIDNPNRRPISNKVDTYSFKTFSNNYSLRIGVGIKL